MWKRAKTKKTPKIGGPCPSCDRTIIAIDGPSCGIFYVVHSFFDEPPRNWKGEVMGRVIDECCSIETEGYDYEEIREMSNKDALMGPNPALNPQYWSEGR